MDYYLIGSRIKELRLSRGMTQEQLAESADISTNFLACIEIGKRKGSFETYSKLVDVLGSSLDYITRDSIEGAEINVLKNELNGYFDKCDAGKRELIVKMSKVICEQDL